MTTIEDEDTALTTGRVGAAPVVEVLRWLDTSKGGLSGAEAPSKVLPQTGFDGSVTPVSRRRR